MGEWGPASLVFEDVRVPEQNILGELGHGFELEDAVTAVDVPALSTAWVSALEVLPLKLPSPPYVAVIECGPTESAVVESLNALPPSRETGDPKFVPSMWNCTLPVGAPAPGDTGATVAVNVTPWPKREGFADEVRTIVVSALPTVCVIGAAVLTMKFGSPA